ncbi:coordinator of PRMT5 and differentiation stimulator isoform X2 [Pipra filicauda]|nr:coordinator of PRMT5 and differentiation stimulator isoform X2 [Pipra filicauda]XP_039246099.1 coordinator of PRMT5 and differentiation stimulator isoform X2 [Pipra filicauda]XP_039246100.1 coordinator of PRMT5 and differentiation stimulator isoform X2 [Pipra filicauda]
MAGAVDATKCEEKQLPNKRETMIWKPRKECLLDNIPNVPDSKSEESEASDASHSEGDDSVSPDDWYNVHFYLDEGDDEVSSIPDSPKLQSASEHEVEDWDKELEESAYGPYGASKAASASVKRGLSDCQPSRLRDKSCSNDIRFLSSMLQRKAQSHRPRSADEFVAQGSLLTLLGGCFGFSSLKSTKYQHLKPRKYKLGTRTGSSSCAGWPTRPTGEGAVSFPPMPANVLLVKRS